MRPTVTESDSDATLYVRLRVIIIPIICVIEMDSEKVDTESNKFKNEFASLRTSLKEFNERINELEKKISDDQQCITIDHMRNRVSDFDPDPKWKAFIADTDRGWFGVVADIMGLLDESYPFFIDCIKEEYPEKKALSILGKKSSKQWFEIQFRAIKKLLDPKDAYEEYDFADTANGCDETVQDAGWDVIKELAESK